uniref:Uncharacterized protein n=2 Tax=unclassified Prevotella TaxID=2638335 RepID=A0AB33J532_9BACT
MKNLLKTTLMALSVLLSCVLTSCHHDDENEFQVFYDHPETISETIFRQQVIGNAWYHYESHEVLADGSINPASYYSADKTLIHAAYNFISPDSVCCYIQSHSKPDVGYLLNKYHYDASHNMIDIQASNNIKILSLKGNRMVVLRAEGSDTHLVSVYTRMTAEDMKYFTQHYTYDFNAKGWLKISVAEGETKVDGTVFEFDVPDYNGSFKVLTPNGSDRVKVEIADKHVKLTLLKNGVDISVTDGTSTKSLWLWSEDKSLMPQNEIYALSQDTVWVNQQGELLLTKDGSAAHPYERFSIQPIPGKEDAALQRAATIGMVMFSGTPVENPGERHYRETRDLLWTDFVSADALKSIAKKPVDTDTKGRIWLTNKDNEVIQVLDVHFITKK